MRIITLWRPWGAAVVLGLKPIETRTHTRLWGLKGERIGIHNAQKWDPHAEREMELFLPAGYPRKLFDRSHFLNTPKAIIGSVYVADARFLEGYADEEAALCRINENDCGLILTMPRPLLDPIPAKGQRGIWNHHFVEVPQQPIKEAEDEQGQQTD